MQCDTCDAWVHTKCAGVEKDIRNKSFNCLECTNGKKLRLYYIATVLFSDMNNDAVICMRLHYTLYSLRADLYRNF